MLHSGQATAMGREQLLVEAERTAASSAELPLATGSQASEVERPLSGTRTDLFASAQNGRSPPTAVKGLSDCSVLVGRISDNLPVVCHDRTGSRADLQISLQANLVSTSLDERIALSDSCGGIGIRYFY